MFDEILNLEAPHGYLISKGKQTAIASPDKLDWQKSYLICTDDEAFGVATLDQPAQIKTKEFDNGDWQEKHRITQRERRQWWSNSDSFYVYSIKEWKPFEDTKLFIDGELVDEPELTEDQKAIVSQSMELPKQVSIVGNAVAITEDNKFFVASGISSLAIKDILQATYDKEPEFVDSTDSAIPIYSLALVIVTGKQKIYYLL